MRNVEKDIQPNVLSDVLLAEYVVKKQENRRFRLSHAWSVSKNFDDHVILYKIALVLLALLNIEEKNKGFLPVRLLFEKAVFTDGNIEKRSFYHHVKTAMDNLGELLDTNNTNLDNLDDQNQKLPWTMACLREAGVLKSDQPILHSRLNVIGMGWAMAWLKEAGVIERNPATLAQFALMWVDNYVTILNYLKEYEPL